MIRLPAITRRRLTGLAVSLVSFWLSRHGLGAAGASPMALVLLDGFDYYTGTQSTLNGWSVTGTMSAGRFGGQAFKPGNRAARTLPSTYTTLIFGVAINSADVGGPARLLTAAGVVVATISQTGVNGFLKVLDSTGATVATGTTPILTDGSTWHYMEVKLVVGATGTVEIHLDGVAGEIASTVGNFGTTAIGQIELANNSVKYDDLYVVDTTGAAPRNTFLGDVRVGTILPSSDGAHTQWTPNSGTTHFNRVNQATPDDDTTYLSDATAGDIDTFGFQDIDAAATVYGVQVNTYARKDDAGTRQIAPVIRQGGADSVGTTVTLGSTYAFFRQLYNQDPTSADWTAANVNADEFGVKVIT